MMSTKASLVKLARAGVLLVGVALLIAACGRATPPALTSPPQASEQESAYPQPPAQQQAYPSAQQAPALSPAEMAYAPPGAEDARTARYPNPIVVYVRQTPAGVIERWTFYQTGRVLKPDGSEEMLSPDQVKPIFDVATSSDFQKLEGTFRPADTCPDCDTYRIIIYGPHEPVDITVVGQPEDLPAPVQEVLQALTEIAQ